MLYFSFMRFCKILGISRFTRFFAPARPTPQEKRPPCTSLPKKPKLHKKLHLQRILPSRIRATIHSRLRSPVEQKLLAQFTCFFINPPFILYLTDIIHHVNQWWMIIPKTKSLEIDLAQSTTSCLCWVTWSTDRPSEQVTRSTNRSTTWSTYSSFSVVSKRRASYLWFDKQNEFSMLCVL